MALLSFPRQLQRLPDVSIQGSLLDFISILLVYIGIACRKLITIASKPVRRDGMPVPHLMKSFSLLSSFFLGHLFSQSLFFFSAESLGLQPLLAFYSHHLHPSLSNYLPEVALQFDDAVETTSESLTGDVATAVSLGILLHELA